MWFFKNQVITIHSKVWLRKTWKKEKDNPKSKIHATLQEQVWKLRGNGWFSLAKKKLPKKQYD